MASDGTIRVQLIGDSSSLQRAFKNVDSAGSRLGSAMRRVGRTVAIGLGAIGAAVGVVVAKTITDLQRIERINAQTAAALKSTGGAAGITAKQIESMAQRIEALTSVEAETVQEGENLLLTFTNIRNKVKGEFVGVFDEATMAITDMSIALDQDMKSSAIQVGKALNDPIKGMSALQRVGVAFTEDQKALVQGWVEHGDTVRAQKFILAELNKEFGGSAKALGDTLTGRIDKVKNSFGNLMEDLVRGLLPAIEKLVTWASDALPKAFAFAEKVVDSITGAFKEGAGGASGLGEAFRGVLEWARKVWPQVQEVITRFVELAREVWDKWGESLINIAQRVWSLVGQTIQNALRVIKGVIDLFLAVLRGDWGAAWDAIKNIVGGVWEQMKDLTSNAIGVLKEVVIGGWRTIKNVVADIVGGMLAFIVKGFTAFVRFWFGVADKILAGAEFAFGWVPKIGDRIQDFREAFDRNTNRIIADLERQGQKFESWGERSRGEVNDVTGSLQRLTDEISHLKAQTLGRINIHAPSGAGFPITGGTPRAMAGRVMAGVPGFQAITSGYRPGDDGFHGVAPPWNAVDIGGTNLPGVYALAKSLFGRSIREMIYGHNIYEHGVERFYSPTDHFDHVHLAKYGFDGSVNRPTLFVAGEAGQEHVEITPGKKRGHDGITINFNGNVYGFPNFRQAVERAIKESLRRP